MARLLRTPITPKVSKAEAAGNASKKLEQDGRLSVVQAAAYLGLHKYTVRDYIENGFIESLLIGKRHYIEAEELERLKATIEVYGSLAKARRESEENDPFTY